MPKSRGRRPRRTHPSGAHPRASRRSRPAGFSVEDQARALLNLPLVQRVDATEARGEVTAALGLINDDLARRPTELLWRPDRIRHLIQLAVFESVLPAWVYSRWILEQAVRWMDVSRRGQAKQALDGAVRTIGGLARYGDDKVDAAVRLVDHDWVYRQLMLYEHGGLQHFLDKVAAGALIARADQVRDWPLSPMGGYRLSGHSARVLAWEDLRTGQQIETPDIGSACLVEVGEHVIGRLVPTIGGPMFESAPLVLPAEVAVEVSHEPQGWMLPLERACRGKAWPQEISTHVSEFPLLCDVPTTLQRLVLCGVAGPGRAGLSHSWTVDPIAGRIGVLRAALDDALQVVGSPDPWPIVGSILLEPSVFTRLALAAPPDPAALQRLAARLVSPASEACLALAVEPDAAA